MENQFRGFVFWLVSSLSLIVFFHANAGWTAAANLAELAQRASQLNQQGLLLLDQGRAQAALDQLQEATTVYQKLDNPQGVAGSRINQSLALQALGLQARACQVAVAALTVSSELCLPNNRPSQPSINDMLIPQRDVDLGVWGVGLKILGLSLNRLGQLPQAEAVLTRAVQISQDGQVSELAQAELALGNTYRLQFDEARNQFTSNPDPINQEDSVMLIDSKSRQTVRQYEKVISKEQYPIQSTQAKLNFINLITEFDAWINRLKVEGVDDFEKLVLEHSGQQQKYLNELITPNVFDNFLPDQRINAKINLAQVLLIQTNSTTLSPTNEALQLASNLLNEAITEAKTTDNNRALSYGYGLLAELNKSTGSDALRIYQTAIAYGQTATAWDIIYRWQQQVADIYESTGQTSNAVENYEGAIRSLNQVSANIAAVNADIQFSFQEQVEPVYRSYLKLLFNQPNKNFQKIIQVNEALQIAELENYLRCGRLNLDIVSLNTLITPTASAIIYVIDLGELTKVVIESSGRYREYSVETKTVQVAAENLFVNIQSPNLVRADPLLLRDYAQTLYDSFLKAADESNALPNDGTIVFVLDKLLQNIPMELLYDGSKFLLERYSIAIAPGVTIREPKALPDSQFRGLVAGISTESPSFSNPLVPPGLTALSAVNPELQQVRRNLSASIQLLNEEFTVKRFDDNLSRGWPIVHISTHGQFSSDQAKTFLLAWDAPIDSDKIGSLLSKNKGLLELLVLSACQTAKGDRQSSLGIAGIATRSGARSTIATLWTVDAESTTVLMSEFYRNFRSGNSKAEALRQAQITLLKSDAFSHPYFWAPFILIGSWL